MDTTLPPHTIQNRTIPIIHDVLPFEIMSTIFRLIPSSRHDLLTIQELGEVSPIWKAISQGTPELWTFFYLHFHVNEPYPELRLLQAYRWLSRSKALPCELEIDVTFSPLPAWLYQSHFRPLLAYVASRLSSFKFCGHIEDYEGLFQNLPESLPQLRSLTFITRRFLSPLQIHTRAFADSKYLTELTISGMLFQSQAVVRESFSVKKLTTLVLEGLDLSPDLAYSVFSIASNLIRCTISVDHIGGEEIPLPASIHAISHPLLQELTLGYLSKDFASLLTPFTFPSLTKLKIMGDPNVPGRILSNCSVSEVLLDLYQRYPFPLEILELEEVMLDVDEFAEFLKMIPMLVELRISGSNDSAALHQMIEGLSSGPTAVLSELKVVTVW